MSKVTLNDRDVDFTVYGNEPDDIQIDRAHYEDTGVELTDVECEKLLEENAGAIYDYWYQNQVMQAEAYADSMEDR